MNGSSHWRQLGVGEVRNKDGNLDPWPAGHGIGPLHTGILAQPFVISVRHSSMLSLSFLVAISGTGTFPSLQGGRNKWNNRGPVPDTGAWYVGLIFFFLCPIVPWRYFNMLSNFSSKEVLRNKSRWEQLVTWGVRKGRRNGSWHVAEVKEDRFLVYEVKVDYKPTLTRKYFVLGYLGNKCYMVLIGYLLVAMTPGPSLWCLAFELSTWVTKKQFG